MIQIDNWDWSGDSIKVCLDSNLFKIKIIINVYTIQPFVVKHIWDKE